MDDATLEKKKIQNSWILSAKSEEMAMSAWSTLLREVGSSVSSGEKRARFKKRCPRLAGGGRNVTSALHLSSLVQSSQL